MKNVLILFLLFFNLISLLGQNRYSKKELEKIFKKSILQPKKSTISIGENSWKICQSKGGSEINMFENSFESQSDCCKYIEWTFYTKNKFISNQTNVCIEPALSTVTTANDWYEIEYIDGENLVLIIKNKIKSEKYLVKGIKKRKDNLHVITLVKT